MQVNTHKLISMAIKTFFEQNFTSGFLSGAEAAQEMGQGDCGSYVHLKQTVCIKDN